MERRHGTIGQVGVYTILQEAWKTPYLDATWMIKLF